MSILPPSRLLPLVALALPFAVHADHVHIEEVIVSGSHETLTIDVADALVASPDAAQLLKKAPGANVNSNGPLTGIPQYRGMYGPRVGVQLNGTQLESAGPNLMDPALSYAAAGQLESLQLYRGIAPVSVVQESIGGAINAVTENRDFATSSDFETSGRVLASGQSVNQGTQLGASVFVVNDQHRIRIAAMTERGDDADFDDGTIEPSEYERDRYELGYGVRLDRHTLQLDYSRTETGDSGTASLPMDIQTINGDLYSAGYLYDGDVWDLDFKVFGSDLGHGMTNYHLRTPPAAAGFRRNDANSDNLGFKLQLTREDSSGRWVIGADGLDAEHDARITNPNNAMFFVEGFNAAERRILGLFAERQHDFGNRWSAELGLRYNNVEMDADEVDGTPAMMMPPATALRDAFNAADRNQTDNNVDAVAKAWYEVDEQWTAYAGVGRKTRTASYQERYLWLPLEATGGLADGRTYTGNIELDPEVASEVELGVDFVGSSISFSPRVFYRDVEDYIQGTPSEVMPANQFVNMMNMNNGTNNPSPLQFNNVDATFWGMDMDWSAQLSEHWSLGGVVSYVRGERDDINDDLYRIAPLNGSVELSYAQSSWGAALTLVAYADQDDVSETNGELETDGYELINLNAWWRPMPSLRLVAGLDNALDEGYEDHLGGYNRARGNADLAVGERIPGYGRNAFVRLDYSF